VKNRFIGENYEVCFIYSKYSPNEEKGIELREQLKDFINENMKGEFYFTGESILLSDLGEIAENDYNKTSNIFILFNFIDYWFRIFIYLFTIYLVTVIKVQSG